jgi:hypothetical protein
LRSERCQKAHHSWATRNGNPETSSDAITRSWRFHDRQRFFLLAAKRQQSSPIQALSRLSTHPDWRDGLSPFARGDSPLPPRRGRNVSTGYDDPVIWFRGEEGEETLLPIDETIFTEPRKRPEILAGYHDGIEPPNNGSAAMLAEKFILIVESLIRAQGQTYPDGSTRVVSTSPHVPVQLPARSGK